MGDVARMALVGGDPSVDFVNTLGGSPEVADDEYLHDPGDLVIWARRSGLLEGTASHARVAAGRRHLGATPASHARVAAGRRHVGATPAVLTDALVLRAHLDAVLRAVLDSRPPDAGHLAGLTDAAAAALSHARLEPAADGFRWRWDPADPYAPLWPVAPLAVDLLRSERLSRLARCGSCRWLFLDASRNRSRRWCSMNACGARVKMRRYRAR